MLRRGKTGIDVNKLSKPVVPEMCGISIVAGVSLACLMLIAIYPASRDKTIPFMLTFLIAALIGALDDAYMLEARTKTFLTALACIPIIALEAFTPRPSLPFVGRTRLTIIYPILIPFAIAVPSNAVNMLDPVNGAMVGTASLVVATAVLTLIISGRYEVAAISAALLGSLVAFYKFNRYPARVFSGNIGSLSVGAAIGAISILGQIEATLVVAMMPQIMNAFCGLSSIGRLFERREIQARPITLLSDGRLAATTANDAPITLARLILAKEPLTENELFRQMMILSGVSAALAIATFFLTPGEVL
jgi:UDP-N-acetylglucosamine--dolichyl-phosphate N-acetylglucosaminephosphotransferase